MRKLLTAAVAAVLLAALVPVLARAAATSPAPVAERLAAQLEAASDDQKLTVLVHGTTKRAALDAIDAAGLEVVLVLESIGVPAAVGTAAQIAELRSQPGVTYVEADAPIEFYLDTALQATRTDEAHATAFPTDCPTAAAQAGAHTANQRALEATACPAAGLFTGAGQSIAIVDSGVDGTHPMFQREDGSSKVVRNMKVACIEGVVWFNDNPATEESDDRFPPNFCTAASAVDPRVSDAYMVDAPTNDSDTPSMGGHGTHVASIAAGASTPFGDRALTGTAPGADIVSISVGQGLNILSADVALDWIARNHLNPCATAGGTCSPITVVNNSYGPDGGGEFDPNSATAKITELLIADGVVMVWANGNGLLADTENRGGDGTENRSNPEGQNPLPGVLSVANYDDGGTGTRDGSLNSSSSRGDASRPETWPDLSAPGSDITAACRPYLAICTSFESDPNFGTIGGTSMAAPHVAGIVTLLREADPSITPAQIEQVLEDTAYRFLFGGPYWTNADADNPDSPTSFDKGHGLVDTMAALTAVTSGVVTSAPTPECPTPAITDTAGDATAFYAVNSGSLPSEPQLDIVAADVAWDAAADALRLTATATDLGETNPPGAVGIVYQFEFTHQGAAYFLRAAREAGNEPWGTLGQTTATTPVTKATDLPATFDAATDTVTALIPNAALSGTDVPTFAVGQVLGDVKVNTHRFAGVPRNPVSTAASAPRGLLYEVDAAGAACPVTLGGTTTPSEPQPFPHPDPEPEPDPGGEPTGPDATLHDGESFVTEVTTTHDTWGVPQVDEGYSCLGPDDPKCFTFRFEVVPGESGSLLNVWLETTTIDQFAVEDWDVLLYAPDGTPIEDLETLLTGGGPQTVTESSLGPAVAVDEPGIYTVVVQPYYAFEGSAIGVHADVIASE